MTHSTTIMMSLGLLTSVVCVVMATSTQRPLQVLLSSSSSSTEISPLTSTLPSNYTTTTAEKSPGVSPQVEVPGGKVVPGGETNDAATRAATYWRQLLNSDPQAAARALMYWRMNHVQDPVGTAKQAMMSRKQAAKDPESSANSAVYYRTLAKRSASYSQQSDMYWRQMAAHDPEVTVRAAEFWRDDPEAAMYW